MDHMDHMGYMGYMDHMDHMDHMGYMDHMDHMDHMDRDFYYPPVESRSPTLPDAGTLPHCHTALLITLCDGSVRR